MIFKTLTANNFAAGTAFPPHGVNCGFKHEDQKTDIHTAQAVSQAECTVPDGIYQ